MSMKVIRTGALDSVYDTDLEVNWLLTSMCNYKCTYCFGQEQIDMNKFSTWRELYNAVMYIKKLSRSGYTITLAGGEPTVHPHFLDLCNLLCDELEDDLKHIIIVTNGSRDVDFYKQLIPLARKTKIKLTVSLHSEFFSIDHIIKLLRELSEWIVLDIRLMFNTEKSEIVKKTWNKLTTERNDYPFRLSVCLLTEPPDYDRIDRRYTDKDILWANSSNCEFDRISEASNKKWTWADWRFFYDVEIDGKRDYLSSYDYNKSLENGMGRFKDMYCLANTSVLSIMSDGVARGGVCQAMTRTFDIYGGERTNTEIDPYIVKCPFENCTCKPNHTIPKFISKAEAEAFLGNYKQKCSFSCCS